jgi:hypothetical protein
MRRITWSALFVIAAVSLAGTALANPPGVPDAKGKSGKDDKKAADAKAAPESKGDDKPFDTVVKDMEQVKGLFTFYRRDDDNKLYMEIAPEQLDSLFLFAASIDHSVGERGFYAAMMGTDFPFYFHRVGKSVQWVQKNTNFTAPPGTPESRVTSRSFPDAILGQAKLQSKPHPDRKSILIDVGELFATKDFPGFGPALSNAYTPTNFSFDKEKSAVTGVHAFPENVLLDVALNYQTDNFRAQSSTLVDGRSVPIAVKYSLSSIPKSAYVPRMVDDRVGNMLVVHQDLSSDHAATPYVRLVERWNLEKQDPNATLSPPKQPIVYWLENTIPLEYRDDVRDGVLLWNKAFEKIGFKDAIVVKQMPDTATWDPADVRYSTIRWFAGTDATFAIGPRRSNPFTGQIYDADIGVSEGIVRNARRLAEEYAQPIAGSASQDGITDDGAPRTVAFAWSKDPRQECDYASGLSDQAALGMTMLDARGDLTPEMEQHLMHQYVVELVAHEVGHTLGLRHNFHGSTLLSPTDLMNTAKTSAEGQSASVMDYNPVIVAPKGQQQGDFVTATLGPYDYWAIEYTYAQVPAGDTDALAKIAERGSEPDLQYSTDEDAPGNISALAMDPLVSQYDASSDPLAYYRKRLELVNELWASMETTLAKRGEGYQVLRRAMSRSLNDDFRSLITSSKFVGGVYHHRDHVGDPNGRLPYEPVPAAKQREALDLLTRYAFGEKAFVVAPSLLNKLAIERNPTLDPGYWSQTRMDYPWHDNVMRIQKAVLDRLYHPVTLGRLLDNELRFPAGQTAFKMADMFSGLNASIWSELDGATGTISSLRRNLQREHLKQLIRLTLREDATTVNAGAGPVQVAAPEDATTLARSSLVRLQTKIRAKLAGKTVLDATTKAHLQESVARINAALSAQMSRGTD